MATISNQNINFVISEGQADALADSLNDLDRMLHFLRAIEAHIDKARSVATDTAIRGWEAEALPMESRLVASKDILETIRTGINDYG